MFLKPSEFKKMLEDCYKSSGFKLYNNGEDMIIHGNYWLIQVDNTMISNKIKALIIELAGELPKENEYIIVRKGELNTFLNEENNLKVRELSEKKRTEMQEAEFTRLIYDSPWKTIAFMNVYDSEKKAKEKILVQHQIKNLIDADYIETEKGESFIEHPMYDSLTKMVLWSNNAMTLGVFTISVTDEDSDLKEILEQVKNIPMKEWLG